MKAVITLVLITLTLTQACTHALLRESEQRTVLSAQAGATYLRHRPEQLACLEVGGPWTRGQCTLPRS